MKCKSMIELIGNTPVLECGHLKESLSLKGNLFAKLELFNATGSAKDRAAYYMILDAEQSGKLKPGGTIIEPTSGNTGIGLAAIGTLRGYRVIIVMPDTMSKERCALMKAYGAELVLSDGSRGMKGAIEEAYRLAEDIADSYIPDQFGNPSNAKAHLETTGKELILDLDGKIDVFIAGVGTGGTLTGVAQALKAHQIDAEIIAVEPDTSAVLSGDKPGPHGIQGIGGGFIPAILDSSLIDRIMRVKDADAVAAAKLFGKEESLLTGISSGAALWAGIQLAGKEEYRDKNIVVLMPDSADRYLSTVLFED